MFDGILDAIRAVPIKEVASRLGIKVGRDDKAMCFGNHDHKTPSLSFETSRNFWNCFGCERGGDGIALVQQYLGLDFKATLQWFVAEFGIQVRGVRRINHRVVRRRPATGIASNLKTPMRDSATDKSADPLLYSSLLERCGRVSDPIGKAYLERHGISSETADAFSVRELRFPEKALTSLISEWGAERVERSGLTSAAKVYPLRLIWRSYTLLFPFFTDDTIQYLQGRQFEQAPKFLNLAGVAKPLFNADRLKTMRRGATVHLCEGVPDALALESEQLPAVGVLGASSFRREWVELFLQLDVVLIPDGDQAGNTFRRRISRFFAERGKTLRVTPLPPGKDAASIVAELRCHK